MDALEAVIRPIVEGQLRSFANDHPEAVAAVDWYKPRRDRAQTLINSMAKRIVRDLLCADTRVRLVAAVSAMVSAEAADSAAATPKCSRSTGGGSLTAPGRAAGGRARAAALSAERRSEIARNAALARWRTPPNASLKSREDQ